MIVTLKSVELRKIDSSSNQDFELLFNFNNDTHHSIGFRKNEIIKETGYKLYSSGLELKENQIFKQ